MHVIKRSVNSWIYTLTLFIVITIFTTCVANGNPETDPQKKIPNVSRVEGTCALFNTITVTVENLSELIGTDGKNLSNVVLYLDGYPLKGIQPRLVGGPSSDLKFDLKFIEETKESWNSLLGKPHLLPPVPRKVSVTVGIIGQPPIATDVKAFNLVVVHDIRLWIYFGILALAIFLFVWLAKNSDIIRDSGPSPGGLYKNGKPYRKTFSLGRTQMAVWFFLVIASFVFIWMVTGAYSTLEASVLALIGISGGTALSATVIDSNKRNEASSQLDTLKEEKLVLEADIKILESKKKATTDQLELDVLNKELTEKNAQLVQLNSKILNLTKATTTLPTEGFFEDILSDASGISFHRFQVAGWTVVLGIIFIASVYKVLSMPDFPTELLALMGISSGTYIGFKFPEKQN